MYHKIPNNLFCIEEADNEVYLWKIYLIFNIHSDMFSVLITFLFVIPFRKGLDYRKLLVIINNNKVIGIDDAAAK